MKTEAIGNGVPRVHENGVAGRPAVVDGDSFSTMLQAIFAARTQSNQAPEKGLHTALGAISGEKSAKDGEALQEWLAIEDPALALALQQQSELTEPAEQALAGLILAGLLEGEATLKGKQNEVGTKAEQYPQGKQPGLWPGQPLGGKAPEQMPELKLEQLPQHLLERIEALARPLEEKTVMEKQLHTATAPLISDKGLSPQATTLVASYLQEGKPLGDLPAPLLIQLREHLEGMELFREGESGEKARPFAALLTRVEKFLNSMLSGGSEEAKAGTARQFGELVAEQQLKGTAQALDRDSQPRFGENDSARAGAVLSGRGEMVAGTRSFTPPTPSFQPHEVMAQVMERLAMLARPGVQELRMQLHPAHLGNMMIKLRNVRGVLSAEILTEHVAVKELLEGQLDALRQRFQDMNMQVEEFRVLVGDEEQEKGGEAGKWGKNPPVNGAAALQQNESLQQMGIPQPDGGVHRVNYLV